MRILILVVGLALAAFAVPAEAQRRPAAGTLISSEPMAGAPAGSRAWRIRYASVDPRRGPVEAPSSRRPTATAGPPAPFSPCAGTSLGSPACGCRDPNVFRPPRRFADMVSRGTVVATDLPSPLAGPHPYLVGDSSPLVLDPSGRGTYRSSAPPPLAVWATQGGHAALFTAISRSPRPTGVSRRPALRHRSAANSDRRWRPDRASSPLMRRCCRTIRRQPRRSARPHPAADPHPVVARLASMPGAARHHIRLAVLRRDLRGVDLSRLQPGRRARENKRPWQLPARRALLIAQSFSEPLVSPDVTRAFARRACRPGAAALHDAGGDHAHSAPKGPGARELRRRSPPDAAASACAGSAEMRALSGENCAGCSFSGWPASQGC